MKKSMLVRICLVGLMIFSIGLSILQNNNNPTSNSNNSLSNPDQTTPDSITTPVFENVPQSADSRDYFDVFWGVDEIDHDSNGDGKPDYWDYISVQDGGADAFDRFITWEDNDYLHMSSSIPLSFNFNINPLDLIKLFQGDWAVLLDWFEVNPDFSGSTCEAYWSANILDQIDGNALANAQVNISWGFNSAAMQTSFAEVYYSKNGGAWTLLPDARIEGGFTGGVTSFSLKPCNINLETDTTLYFKIKARLDPTLASLATLDINYISVGTFRSEISDNTANGGLYNLLNPLEIELDIHRCGTDSNIVFSAGYFRLEIKEEGASEWTSVFGDITTDLNDNDHVTVSWSYSDIALDTSYIYRINITDRHVINGFITYVQYYVSSEISVHIFEDNDDPTLNTALICSDNNETLDYGQSFNISGSATDVPGGSQLYKVVAYWDTVTGVDKDNYDGCYEDYTISGDSDTFTISIPSEEFILGVPMYIRLYVYDGALNYDFSNLVNITANDLSAPLIIWDETIANNVVYDSDKTIKVNLTEIEGASGVDGNSIHFYYGINDSIKGNADELTPNLELANSWNYYLEYKIPHSLYVFNQTIYVWLDCEDNYDQPRSSSRNFKIIDTHEPVLYLIDDVQETNTSIGIVGCDFLISVSATDPTGGSGIASVELFYQMNRTFKWDDEYPNFQPTAVEGDTYRFLLKWGSEYVLTEGVMFFIVRTYDVSGNYDEVYGGFEIPVTREDIDGGSDDWQPNTNDNNGDEGRPISSIDVFFIVVGSVGGIFLVKKYMDKRKYQLLDHSGFLDKWEKNAGFR